MLYDKARLTPLVLAGVGSLGGRGNSDSAIRQSATYPVVSGGSGVPWREGELPHPVTLVAASP